MAVSLAESTVFRKLAKPATIPAKLWLTFKFVQATNDLDEERQEAGGGGNNDEGNNASSPNRSGRGGGRDEKVQRGGKPATVVDASREPQQRSLMGGGGVRSEGWGKNNGKKRKAKICPPGRSRGQGCFVPSLTISPHLSKPARFW